MPFKNRKPRILTVFGTRPEAIKLAPVIQELAAHSDQFESLIGLTGQHDSLLQQVIDIFQIKADFNLRVMQPRQSLAELTSTMLVALNAKLKELQPDLILVQGDTTTVFTAALAAYYHQIKIGHVEAGLRTGDKYQPFPEELNRVLTDQLSDLCFAPTEFNRQNLLAAGIGAGKIHVTGNTIIDALQTILAHPFMESRLNSIPFNGKMVLVTIHRRESFGKPLQETFQAVRRLAQMHSDILFVYPVHPNPNVLEPAQALLKNLPNLKLTAPLNYLEFVAWMQKAYLILTDSGGVQEEAPALHKPVLVLREKTERPEVVLAGGAKLVGTNQDFIIREVNRLIEDQDEYDKMSRCVNPYGDGTASQKIVNIIHHNFYSIRES